VSATASALRSKGNTVSDQTLGGGYRLPDPSLASRTIARSSRGHFNGGVIADFGPGRLIRTESHLELVVLLILLMRPDIVDVVEQLPPIDYLDLNGTWTKHSFDFLATRSDGSRLALAVKPWKVALRQNLVKRLARVRAHMPSGFADCVRLITERHVDPVDKHNAWLLHGARHPEPEVDAAAAAVIERMTDAVRLQDLAEAIGMAGAGMRALVRLIRAGRLRTVAHERIGPETFVAKVETTS
jgi:hypothetical protein